MKTENNQSAFHAAMHVVAQMQPAATDMVQYTSHGRVLVLAPPTQRVEAEVPEGLTWAVVHVHNSDALEISGYLGAFNVRYDGKELPAADMIIDYHLPPLIQQHTPALRTLPLGYFAVNEDEENILLAAQDMVGNFTKPRYFNYQSSLCAHATSSVSGCNRCIDACSTQAITSAGDKITVNPYLCQGCGGCVMTCPGGALRYAYPSAEDMLGTLRNAISAYCRVSDHAPVILFYAADNAAAVRQAKLPAHVLPIAVEEVGTAGLEVWFALLAYGAAHVAVYTANNSISALANEQLAIALALLAAVQLPPAISVVETLASVAALPPAASLTAPAQFIAGNDKRHIFFMALNHFVAQAEAVDDIIALPAAAPFGEIVVNKDKCTLCMACAGACPMSAVNAGNSAPRLLFIEENCVQCGLCVATCPEDAITLTPRMMTDKSARRQSRVLNEDAPLHCLRCQKPFASTRIVEKIEEKLKAHWMFRQPQEMRRLRLCEECRVIDMFDSESK